MSMAKDLLKHCSGLPTFGDWIETEFYLVRDKWTDVPKHFWKLRQFKEVRTGIFLGFRTLANGNVSFDTGYDSGDYVVFHSKEYVKVALVCFSDRENPKYVSLDKLKKL